MAIQLVIEESPVCFVRSLQTKSRTFYRIMYLMGGLDRYNRPIYRSIQRSIHRSRYDRVYADISVEYRPMYRPIVHLMILLVSVDISTAILSMVYRSTIGYISVNWRSSLGRHSTDISTDTVDRYIDRY